jgi:hypothetical protein
MKVLRTFFLTRTLIGFVVASLCFSSMAYSETENNGKRGDAPQCQKECLKEHSEKMAMLDKGLSKTGKKFAYQDQVAQEENRYARCLENCREVISIK